MNEHKSWRVPYKCGVYLEEGVSTYQWEVQVWKYARKVEGRRFQYYSAALEFYENELRETKAWLARETLGIYDE